MTADNTSLRVGDPAFFCDPFAGRLFAHRATVVEVGPNWVTARVHGADYLPLSFWLDTGRRMSRASRAFLSPTLPAGYKIIGESK